MSPRVYTRRFDWDEARALRAQGMTLQAIANRLGVSETAIHLATNDRARAMQENRNAELQRSGICADCGGSCSYNPAQPVQRCRDCANAARRTSVRPRTLRCVRCREWKSDRAFAFDRNQPGRRGRHKECTACSTEMRSAYRANGKVPCDGGCGRMVEGKGRANTRGLRDGTRVQLDPNRPYLCVYCSKKKAAA